MFTHEQDDLGCYLPTSHCCSQCLSNSMLAYQNHHFSTDCKQKITHLEQRVFCKLHFTQLHSPDKKKIQNSRSFIFISSAFALYTHTQTAILETFGRFLAKTSSCAWRYSSTITHLERLLKIKGIAFSKRFIVNKINCSVYF